MIGLRRALIVIGLVAFALGLAVIPVVLSSDHSDSKGAQIAATLLIGWSFVGTGIYAWWRRPGNRIGSLMVLTGFFSFLFGFVASNSAGVLVFSALFSVLAYGFLVQLIVSFPDGRLQTRLEWLAVVLVYLVVTVVQLGTVLFADSKDPSICGPECPANPLMITDSESVVQAFRILGAAMLLVAVPAALVALRRRWLRWNPQTRRSFTPVLWLGAAEFVLQVVLMVDNASGTSDSAETPFTVIALLPIVAIPFAYLYGVLRTRISQADAVGDLVSALARSSNLRSELVDSMADALGDPRLEIAFWVPDIGGYVDPQGVPVEVPEDDHLWTPVEHDGRPIAALLHGSRIEGSGENARTLAAAAALNLENERLEAELRSRVRELRASRSRLVEAGDAERTRVERNLHDGAQQRLVSLALSLRLARTKLDEDPDGAAGLLDEASLELDEATRELRELARGIHPAILTDRGLQPALEALVSRASLPVELDCRLEGRPAARVEAAAYYVVTEALTNVARHANADQAEVKVTEEAGHVLVEVSDDGRGGADPEGSGLRGLADRVGAADGTLAVSRAGSGGTIVRASIPAGEGE